MATSSGASAEATLENVINLLDSDGEVDDPHVVSATDSHRDDRTAAQAQRVYQRGGPKAPRRETASVNDAPDGEDLSTVLKVLETPRVNKKEFFIERVWDGSSSKCQGRPNGVQCKTPVLAGSLQPGFEGIFVYYATDPTTGCRSKVKTKTNEFLNVVQSGILIYALARASNCCQLFS